MLSKAILSLERGVFLLSRAVQKTLDSAKPIVCPQQLANPKIYITFSKVRGINQWS